LRYRNAYIIIIIIIITRYIAYSSVGCCAFSSVCYSVTVNKVASRRLSLQSFFPFFLNVIYTVLIRFLNNPLL